MPAPTRRTTSDNFDTSDETLDPADQAFDPLDISDVEATRNSSILNDYYSFDNNSDISNILNTGSVFEYLSSSSGESSDDESSSSSSISSGHDCECMQFARDCDEMFQYLEDLLEKQKTDIESLKIAVEFLIRQSFRTNRRLDALVNNS